MKPVSTTPKMSLEMSLETITKKPSTLTYVLVACAGVLAIITFLYITYVATKAYEMNFQPIVMYEGDKKIYDI